MNKGSFLELSGRYLYLVTFPGFLKMEEKVEFQQKLNVDDLELVEKVIKEYETKFKK